MKLAFTTLGCPDWSYKKILDEAQKLGYTGLEIRGIEGEMRADKLPQFFPENLDKTKAELKEKGLKIVGFGSSVRFHDNYDESIEEGKLAIDVCSLAGIPVIRVFGDQVVSDETIPTVIKGLKILCEHAKGKNVLLLLEIHGTFNTLENVMPVVEGMKGIPEFGILWDVAHSDKTYGAKWMEFYTAIKPYIHHIHFKDHKHVGDEFKLCMVGEGDIPLGDIYKTLMKDGYSGWISLEWEKKWHPDLPEPEVAFPEFVKFMKKLEA